MGGEENEIQDAKMKNQTTTRRGMALLGAYFSVYVGIGFIYPLVTGGDTLLKRLVENREPCQPKDTFRRQ